MTHAPLPFFVSRNDPPAKQSILLSAMDLFASRGVDGVTVRDIAARSGYSNPALFKHFSTKEDLARSLFETCYRRLAATVMTPSADLRSAITGALALIETSPDAIHFVLENLRRYWRDLPDDARALGLPGAVRRLVETAQARGGVRPGVDANLAAALILGLVAQIARMAHFEELPRRPSEMTADILDLIEHGLGG
ncbi:MAG: TetR/AcrR family transcriptional regulator [Phenylobacterium sp.]